MYHCEWLLVETCVESKTAYVSGCVKKGSYHTLSVLAWWSTAMLHHGRDYNTIMKRPTRQATEARQNKKGDVCTQVRFNSE